MEKKKHKGLFQARRERRIERRRQEIMEAAAEVFAERGYANTTTKEIALTADVSEGTLYNYFSSKRDILLAIVDEQQNAIEKMLASVGQLENQEDIVSLVYQSLNSFLTRLPFTRAVLTEAWVDDDILQEFVMARLQRIARLVQTFIAKCVNAGFFRPFDAALVTPMVIGMFLMPITPALRGVAPPPTPEELRALVESAVSILLEGLRVHTSEEWQAGSEE